jgi:hypothetical protein
MKYTTKHSIVVGTQVEVIKEMVAEVTKLPHSCERWYS